MATKKKTTTKKKAPAKKKAEPRMDTNEHESMQDGSHAETRGRGKGSAMVSTFQLLKEAEERLRGSDDHFDRKALQSVQRALRWLNRKPETPTPIS
jgi:hypothetical protein